MTPHSHMNLAVVNYNPIKAMRKHIKRTTPFMGIIFGNVSRVMDIQ